MQNVTVKGNSISMNLEIAVFIEDGIWVAYCPALEVSSYGDSKEDAQDAIEDALSIFFEETTSRGTLESELLKLGWSLRKKPKVIYMPPELSMKQANKLIQKQSFATYKERVAIPV